VSRTGGEASKSTGTADRFSVQDRVVVVSGASGGLGEMIARGLGDAGAKLVLGARRVDQLHRVASDLPEAVTVRCDVTEDDDRAGLVAVAVERYGRIDGLVNNAGVMYSKPALKESADEFRSVLETNLVAPFDLARRCAEIFRRSGGGSIVNVTSMTGIVTVGQHSPAAAYAASKAGLAHLTRELAVQWGRHNIRVNSVAPGWFPTAMVSYHQQLPTWFADRLVIKRYGEAPDIVAAVVYLLSDAAAFVTGAELVVDGGRTIT
jgi:NAD(P)-dependent dehydrogenase (short-subunit alcohol dehydrogenase family)